MDDISNALFESAAMVDSLPDIAKFIARAEPGSKEWHDRTSLMAACLPIEEIDRVRENSLRQLKPQFEGFIMMTNEDKETAMFGAFIKAVWNSNRHELEWTEDLVVAFSFVLYTAGWKDYISREDALTASAATAAAITNKNRSEYDQGYDA